MQLSQTVLWHESLDFCRSELGVKEWIVFGPSAVLLKMAQREYPRDAFHFHECN